MRPRRARAGLVPLHAADLWAAVDAGEFPPPVTGPWGITWRLDDVHHWRRHHT